MTPASHRITSPPRPSQANRGVCVPRPWDLGTGSATRLFLGIPGSVQGGLETRGIETKKEREYQEEPYSRCGLGEVPSLPKERKGKNLLFPFSSSCATKSANQHLVRSRGSPQLVGNPPKFVRDFSDVREYPPPCSRSSPSPIISLRPLRGTQHNFSSYRGERWLLAD